MVTILGSLVGFLSALFPDIFKLLRDKSDRQHELALAELQMQLQAQGRSERLEEIALQTDAAMAKAAYQTYHSGIGWVDALNGTVRPVLAYGFFMLYVAVKWMQYQMLTLPWQDAVGALWQPEDQAVFSAIISFYFGQRAMRKIHAR